MISVICHHDHNELPRGTESIIPVQLFGKEGHHRGDIYYIGNSILKNIRRLNSTISTLSMDFLTFGLAVTAADTFAQRVGTADNWVRKIKVQMPTNNPDVWNGVKEQLIKALNFLSGDLWELEFHDNGMPPPSSSDLTEEIELDNLDCASLFSGGLDSAIGVIDLLEDNMSPILVSHSYKGDNKKQNSISSRLSGNYERLSLNADPKRSAQCQIDNDTSMRTRSLNFIAFGVLAAEAVKNKNELINIDLYIPENGFISINAPLTIRRIGSLSTRTTHPYFISMLQGVLDVVGLHVNLKNPYQFKTKGDMAIECKNTQLLREIIDDSVSCSHWKRDNQQCGYCVPCIVRRSSLHKFGYAETQDYVIEDPRTIMNNERKRDDIMSLLIAIRNMDRNRVQLAIADSGQIEHENLEETIEVVLSGLNEIEAYFNHIGIS